MVGVKLTKYDARINEIEYFKENKTVRNYIGHMGHSKIKERKEGKNGSNNSCRNKDRKQTENFKT